MFVCAEHEASYGGVYVFDVGWRGVHILLDQSEHG